MVLDQLGILGLMDLRRSQLLELLDAHSPFNSVEARALASLRDFVAGQTRALDRNFPLGHVTASAWITDSAATRALLVHHAKLGRWLQPGGHLEAEDLTIAAAAAREAREETGLSSPSLVQPAIFDVDIHAIPARASFPGHFHYDVRFLFEANPTEEIVRSEESHAVAWVDLSRIHDLNPEESVARMVAKTVARRARFAAYATVSADFRF